VKHQVVMVHQAQIFLPM